jgi:hypothetical protein
MVSGTKPIWPDTYSVLSTWKKKKNLYKVGTSKHTAVRPFNRTELLIYYYWSQTEKGF